MIASYPHFLCRYVYSILYSNIGTAGRSWASLFKVLRDCGFLWVWAKLRLQIITLNDLLYFVRISKDRTFGTHFCWKELFGGMLTKNIPTFARQREKGSTRKDTLRHAGIFRVRIVPAIWAWKSAKLRASQCCGDGQLSYDHRSCYLAACNTKWQWHARISYRTTSTLKTEVNPVTRRWNTHVSELSVCLHAILRMCTLPSFMSQHGQRLNVSIRRVKERNERSVELREVNGYGSGRCK